MLCQTCDLRFKMCPTTTITNLYMNEASKTSSSSSTTTPCTACLDILTPSSVFATTTNLLQKLSIYELSNEPASTTYVLNIDIPLSISIVRHTLTARFCSVEMDLVPTVRTILYDALNILIPQKLSNMIPTQDNTIANFRLDIACNNPLDEQDVRIVIPSHIHPAKRRKRHGGGGGGDYAGGESSKSNTNPRVSIVQSKFDRSQVARASRAYVEEAGYVLSLPPPPDFKAMTKMSAQRNPTFLEGHYIKLQRGLTQSPWFIDGKRRGNSSVQEMLCEHVVAHFNCRSLYKFHSAGREDMDVRMLGKGRPFVIELIDAIRDPAMVDATTITELGQSTEVLHDGAVKSINLRRGLPSCMAQMLDGAEKKQKTYLCLVQLSRKPTTLDFQVLENCKNLRVMQQTPIRVLHRRTQMNREKRIPWMKCHAVPNTNCFRLEICTSAGAYVKEIIHGDRGRTHPCIGSLLNVHADILQLDVQEIVENK